MTGDPPSSWRGRRSSRHSLGDPAVIEAQGITVAFGSRVVLSDVELTVCHGQTVAIIGHNGAGKSTLLRVVFGLVRPQAGTVRIRGEIVRHGDVSARVRAGVVYLPQGASSFPELSVRDNLAVGGLRLPRRDASRGVARVLARFPQLGRMLDRAAATLSGGERQILGMAMALVSSPRVLLLDEPTAGLSSVIARRILGEINAIGAELSMTTVIVEHRVRDVLAASDRVYCLRNGRVAFGGPASDLADESRLRQIYL